MCQIIIDHAVHNVNAGIITARGEQRVGIVEADLIGHERGKKMQNETMQRVGILSALFDSLRLTHLAQCKAMEAERFVWRAAQIKIEPSKATVVAANDDVVSARMHSQTGKPLDLSK